MIMFYYIFTAKRLLIVTIWGDILSLLRKIVLNHFYERSQAVNSNEYYENVSRETFLNKIYQNIIDKL